MHTTIRPRPRILEIGGTEYSVDKTYRAPYNGYWQSTGRRDDDRMPLMESSDHYGGLQRDGMSIRRLDDLVEEFGPLTDADPDLAGKPETVARALRNYRNSIRLTPSRLSPGRSGMVLGRLQQAVEHLAEQLGLDADAPVDDEPAGGGAE